MAARKIVRNSSDLSGRWHLHDTRAGCRSSPGGDGLRQRYASIALTDEEIDAIMAFEFPAIREPSISVNEQRVTVQCECGEESSAAATAPETDITCPCDRTWRIRLMMEQVSGPKPAQLPTDDE